MKKATILFISILAVTALPFPTLADSIMEEWRAEFLKNLPQENTEEHEKFVRHFSSVDEYNAYMDSIKNGPIDNYYAFGKGICDALERGMSKAQILEESFYHFWGVYVSDAMYKASTAVICPNK